MGSRPSFPWQGKFGRGWGILRRPSFVANMSGLGQDLSHYGPETSLTPPSGSRSVTGSPPRALLSPEQRELKRQRDQARHNSKMQARSRRAGSRSSPAYSPPLTLEDLTSGAPSMPVYTTAQPPMSLMADAPTVQYMPPYSSPIPDHGQPSMFPNNYQPSPYMSDYGYASATSSGLSPHYGYVQRL